MLHSTKNAWTNSRLNAQYDPIILFMIETLDVKSLKTSSKSREMLRSVLGTGLLVTVYHATFSVAPGEPEIVPCP